MIIFSILVILVVILDLIVAVNAVHKKKWEGKYLGATMILAAAVNVSYLWSVLTKTYFWMSFANSLYFSSISIMLMLLMQYIARFTQFQKAFSHRSLLCVMRLYLIFDVLVQMINPFKEISMHYIVVEESVTKWVYEPKLLYDMHLGYSYAILAYIAILLIIKTYKTPNVYRAKYLSVLIGLTIVVGLNGAFLFLYKSEVLDVSILFYIGIGFFLYWNTFHYSERGMLNKVRQLVIDEFGSPVILFDNRQLLTMYNAQIQSIVSTKVMIGEYTLQHFLRDVGFENKIDTTKESTSFQYEAAQRGKIYRCDYNVLRDRKGRIIGYLFVLIDKSMEIDLLTGFRSKQSFMRHFSENEKVEYPVGIGLYDINRLAQLNRTAGELVGDKAIKLLADSMKKEYPEGSYYARLDDALLCVVCPFSELKEMRTYTAQIRQRIEGAEFKQPFGIQCVLNVADEDVLTATEAAVKSMRSKKLLDKTSAHSSLLDSLVETQQEGDDATEEHVKRTRLMGERLGVRLGLTDIDISKMALLCLLHDIGKVGVPLEILNKPSRLNDTEGAVMRSHVEKGYRIAMASPELEEIAPLILHHHECWDGSGYPDGLSKESIPFLSRMIAVLDSYDAMTNDRPYRKAMSEASARQELKRCAGTQFDPYIVSEFVQMLEEEHPLTEEEQNMGERTSILPKGLDNLDNPGLESDQIHQIIYSKYIMDLDCNILKVDDNFERITGYKKADIEQYHLTQWDLIFKEELQAYQAQVSKLLLEKQEAYLEHRIRRSDGSSKYVFCYGKQFFSSAVGTMQSEVVVCDIADSATVKQIIQDRRRNIERDTEIWIDQIRRDPLTKLFNREAYKNDVETHLLEDTHTLLFFMLDIDYFKTYNDTFGHMQGDKLLMEMAKELFIVTKHQGIAARIGGDEFSISILLEKNPSPEKAQQYMEMIYKEIAEALASYDEDVTISMGATISTQERHNFHDLYQTADEALYQSKEAGRNQCSLKI